MHLETMEPGATYCVKARTFVKAIGRYSAFSQAECVKVQGKAICLPLVLSLLSVSLTCPLHLRLGGFLW